MQDTSGPCITEHGMPSVLVLTGNAQRAADIARALRGLLPKDERPQKRHKHDKKSAAPHAAPHAPSVSVAKLFARHFKVSEQEAWLRAESAPLGVGTPHRVQALIERGALRLDHMQAIIIDFSWQDAKQRTILETSETRDAVLTLLGTRAVQTALQRTPSPCRVALY